MRADVLFMSTTAISGGVAYQPDQDMAIAKRAMIAAAARRVLLVDHSKFGRVALHRLAPLTAFDLVMTDDGIDDAGLRQLQEAQVAFEVVSRESSVVGGDRRLDGKRLWRLPLAERDRFSRPTTHDSPSLGG